MVLPSIEIYSYVKQYIHIFDQISVESWVSPFLHGDCTCNFFLYDMNNLKVSSIYKKLHLDVF